MTQINKRRKYTREEWDQLLKDLLSEKIDRLQKQREATRKHRRKNVLKK